MPSILPIPAIADDILLVDDVEYVTYQARASDGTVQATYTNVVGLGFRVEGAIHGMGGGGQLPKDTRTWHILARTLPVGPKKGDHIISDVKGTWEAWNDNSEVFEGQHTIICTRIPDAPPPIPPGAILDEAGAVLLDETAAARALREANAKKGG